MYIPMVRKGIVSGALALCLLLPAAYLPAMEKTVELGKEALWADLQTVDGVTRVSGRWGFQDLALAAGEYAPDKWTELLLHFDAASEGDAAGAWSFTGPPPDISPALPALGSGSARFSGARAGTSLGWTEGSLFSPGSAWGDFTIEFWLYPATLADGETVFVWSGATRDGKEGKLVTQSARCSIKDRRLLWEFDGIFALPAALGGARLPMTLLGARQLLPRAWHHHLLRFDSRIGLLEYALDGAPEAVVHATSNGRESGAMAAPRVGRERSGPLILGPGFTGFIDELRISRRYVETPTLQRYLGKTGTATSRIIDLGFSSTRVLRIEAVTSTPADSSVEFYYQVADAWTRQKNLLGPSAWVPFAPPGDFKDGLRGRYVQLMVELFPDGTRTHSPRVSSLRVVYEPNFPPIPPAGLAAAPGNGKVTLSWRKVNEPGVKGYRIYYGGEPRSYLGNAATEGPSPLEAGEATTFTLNGLENGTLYYFAVVAVDTSDPPQQSEFSAEVSARPSRIYK
jgi:hypothetical protein